MKHPWFFLLLLLLPTWAWSQNTPKYSNEFLAIGVGARALAMANAQVAITEDATAGYWNPAGLLHIQDDYAFSLMHASYFAGMANYDYGGFALKIDSLSRLGASIIRFGVDDIPDTRFLFDADGNLNYNNIRSFSAADYAFILSYARLFPNLKNLQLGANFKVIHRSVGIFANAWGIGLDVGAQWQHKNWRLGLVGRDITGTYNAWYFNPETFYDVFNQTGNTIPDNSVEITLPRMILDGAYYWDFLKQKGQKPIAGVMITAGADITFDGKRNTLAHSDFASIDPHAGMELNYKKTVFIRGGIGQFQKIKDFNGSTSTSFQPNFGLGLQIKAFTIDYALTDIGDQAEGLYSHVFSVQYSFSKKQ
ncbi:PorV/PorQ family protein [Rapidithrix thailandica]|uniref:PorV/PorQ family protein n=1 Tax=Rapidithrix thailandica TaxID=413964 RepID=A0AAW9SDV5_9BACT